MSSPVPPYESAPPPRGDESVCLTSSDSSRDNERPSASPTRGSFQEWFKNDQNVMPDQRFSYLMMMMTTIDNEFYLKGILKQMQNKKKDAKPKLDYYNQEFMRRSAKMGLLGSTTPKLSNKTIPQMLSLLNGPLQLTDEDDIRFVRKRVTEHIQKVLHVATKRMSAGKTSNSISESRPTTFCGVYGA
jgi:hypothetical protein